MIAASKPGQYTPRPDQIAAAIEDHRRAFGRVMSVDEARMACTKNFERWRDRKRNWKWVQTGYGTYVQVEDTEGPLPWPPRESLRRIRRVIASIRRDQ